MSRTKRTAFCLAMAILFVFSMLMLGMGVWRTHAEGTQIVDDLTGFTMVHEKSNLTAGTENGAATFKPATDATAYAVYKAPSAEGFVDFTVKFWSTGTQGDYEWRADTEGSLKAEIAISAGGSAVATQSVENGKTASVPEPPVREGYEFVGWLLDGKAFDFATPITDNITLTASWKELENENIPPDDVPEEGGSCSGTITGGALLGGIGLVIGAAALVIKKK